MEQVAETTLAVLFLAPVVSLVVQGALSTLTARTKETISSKREAQKHTASLPPGQVVPISPSSLEFLEAEAGRSFTGRSRQFAFVGPGTTLSVDALTELGVFNPPPDPLSFRPGFLFSTSRPASLGPRVGSVLDDPSLLERLRLSNGLS